MGKTKSESMRRNLPGHRSSEDSCTGALATPTRGGRVTAHPPSETFAATHVGCSATGRSRPKGDVRPCRGLAEFVRRDTDDYARRRRRGDRM